MCIRDSSQLHAHAFVIEPKQPEYYVVPLLAAYSFYYPYPPILPLALATPSVHYEYGGDAAFKLVFCPRGIDANTSRDVIIDPPFADGDDFQSNTHTFFTNRFVVEDEDMDMIEETIDYSSSIWILALILLEDDTWRHQIVGGVVYSNHEGNTTSPRSVYIELLAIQQPDHDDAVPEELSPEVAPEFFRFNYGDDKYHVSLDDWLHAPFLKNQGAGSRRLGVLLLVIVQELHPVMHCPNPSASHIYLQCAISSFAYRRYCRLGFRYSLLHIHYSDLSINPYWPLCQDVIEELPLALARLATYYCFGPDFKNIRLLLLDDFLSKMYPPCILFGTPEHMADEEKSAYFHKWRHSNFLPDPMAVMSCNYSPSIDEPDIYQYIKKR